MNPISVMLVDDNPTFLRVTAQFLEAHTDVVIAGTANGGEEALSKARALQPQVILIDLAMPDLPGLKAIPRLREMLPETGIIALTVMNTRSFREAALAAGANIFLPKANMRTDLLPAIRQLVHGNGQKKTQAPGNIPVNNTLHQRRILVMEDDDYLRRLYYKALHSAGYEVNTAGTVQEARDILTQAHFDLLLCDIKLGDERSTDLLNEYASALFTSGAQVVIVSGQPQYRDMCTDLGVDFFLEKPVAIGTLVTLVDRLTARDA